MRCKNISIIWVRILSAVSLMGSRNRVFGHICASQPKIIEKPGFWATRAIEETGFLAASVHHIKNYRKNPVSGPRGRSKKPGFWPHLCITTKNYRKNPVSGLRVRSHKPDFWPHLCIAIKNSGKNPVSGHPCVIQETGFFPHLRITTKNSGKNPVSGPRASVL